MVEAEEYVTTQTFVTAELSTRAGIFLSRSQILLLLAFTESDFNRADAFTELNFASVQRTFCEYILDYRSTLCI